MSVSTEAEAALKKIIEHGPGTGLRKAADGYLQAVQSGGDGVEEAGKQFEAAIAKVPIDYRSPAMQCLDKFNTCRDEGADTEECYAGLAIEIASRIVHVI